MSRRPTLVDAGPLVAIVSPDDEHHRRCSAALARIRLPMLSTWAIVAEAAWLVRMNQAATRGLFEMLTSGGIEIPSLDVKPAIAWCDAFLRRYASMHAQLADATLLYLAEQVGSDAVFTLDVRDFSVYRLSRNRRVRIVPE